MALPRNFASFYDKIEVDTILTDYMTTLSITETLINSLSNYATITFLGDNFYDKLYLDNQFSLKADASNHYNKTETDNLLLSYATGSYVDFTFYNKSDTDYLLANKVSTTGDATISGNLDVGKVKFSTKSNSI